MDEETRIYVQAFLEELRETNRLLRRVVDFMIDKDPKTVREILDREGLV